MASGFSPRRVAISLEMEWGFRRHLDVYAGCQRYADDAGWECTINPAVDEVLRDSDPKKPPFDGVIARVTQKLAAAAARAGVPLVNVWLNSPAGDSPGVFPDFNAVGAMAADHLLSRGFRQFGYLGFQRDIGCRQHLKGYRSVIEAAGMRCAVHRFPRASLHSKPGSWTKFVNGIHDWIDTWEPPIGVFVVQDLHARYLHDLCRARGLHVSQDVAIVGQGNEPAICEGPSPTLTSIDLGYTQVGYRAAAMLDRFMNGDFTSTEPELVPPPELIPRQSTDSFAAEDPLVVRALRYISENSHERIEVSHVAQAIAATRRTLERRFRASVGRTLAEEITRFRLERAKRRMVETDEPLKTVAQDCGFISSNHFYKTFVRIEEMTPTQFREARKITRSA